MLTRLSIKNYVLIEELDISFDEGLSIITGETGAGKSILLGALNLILGQRADSSNVMNASGKCIIEADFDISSYDLETFFTANELDHDKHVIVRREITSEGKSRSFINDTPVTLNLLRELGEKLVDIHSQHETLLINNKQFQLSVIDAYANNRSLLNEYGKLFHEYKSLNEQLAEVKNAEQRSKADEDYFRFQFDELETARLQADEVLTLEEEQERLANADDIVLKLSSVNAALNGEDDTVIQRLTFVRNDLQQMSKYGQEFRSLSERIQTVLIELKDIADEAEQSIQNITTDPDALERIRERLNLIYQLLHKHRVEKVSDLIELHQSFKSRLEGIESLDERISQLTKEVESVRIKLKDAASCLTNARMKAIPAIEKQVISQLSDLAMPHATLKISVTTTEEFSGTGTDRVQFFFAANKGAELKEIQKAASGGELSRLMLCIKSLQAKSVAMPTVIFDEIDTGISGETAAKTGNILRQMAIKHQVIAISHLPQIAAQGNHHFQVYKEVLKKSTRTGLRPLKNDERVSEIARMLSGEQLTEAALLNARELLGSF